MVRSAEIRRTRLKSNSQFAACLKLGASFPSLKLNVAATDDFKPRWADHPNEGERVTELVEDDDANDDSAPAAPVASTPPDSNPTDAPAAQSVSLPLEQYVPHHPYRSGGGRSY
ncbi:MAG: hypothetical protein WCD79_22720 [Chthoniobacteraceae bacterium]